MIAMIITIRIIRTMIIIVTTIMVILTMLLIEGIVKTTLK